MIIQVFSILQIILIQVISAQLSTLPNQNVLNNIANTPLSGYGRSRRQIENPPVGSPESGDLPVNGFANSLPLRNGMPSGNYPRASGLTNHFGLKNGLPNNLAFNNGLPNSFGLNNEMALPYNSPFNLPLPNVNLVPQHTLKPIVNGVNINGLPFNIPNGLPSKNNVPNALPSFNNVPNALPSFNNVPNALPSFNNVPNVFSSFKNVQNGLPSMNKVPNILPNISNLPLPNKFLNIKNVPAGINILNLNNLPAASSLPNVNNILRIPNGFPSFNNLPCGNTLPPLPVNKELPLNNLPSGNLLPPLKNQLPYFNNFRITEIGIENGVADMSRLPRNNLAVGNMVPNANNLQSGNGLTQQVADELSNIIMYENANQFSGLNNPFTNKLPNNVAVDDRISSINHFPIGNVARNINNMQLNNGLTDFGNFQNRMMPINEQAFVNNVPFNDGFAVAINFPANTALPKANSRLVNAINNDMPLSNGEYLNDILFANNGMAVNMPETYIHSDRGKGFPRNNVQFGNVQLPANNWHYDLVGAKMPGNRNVQPEEVQIFSNVPSDNQSVLMPNNLNLTQELIKNLKIDGNMSFLNGLPVAGITETVTVLNGPYSN